MQRPMMDAEFESRVGVIAMLPPGSHEQSGADLAAHIRACRYQWRLLRTAEKLLRDAETAAGIQP